MARLRKRMVKRERNGVTFYYWRRQVTRSDGAVVDQRRSLGTDWDEALARYDAVEADPPSPEPEPVPEPPVTVEAFSRRWLAEYAASKRTHRGHDQAQQRFRDYLWPRLGAAVLSTLRPADIRRLSADLEGGGVGLVTRRRVLEDLRCCLRYAVEEAEALDRLPWRRGMLPKLPEAAPDPLSDLELADALRTMPDSWRPAALFAVSTGLRWGEQRALDWKDVRESPYPHLVVSKSHDGPTKSRKVREVPLLPEAEAVLDGLERGHGRVFSLPETASWVRRHVIRHARVKTLAGFHWHRFRHTFASQYLERGGSLEALQRILGHASSSRRSATDGCARMPSPLKSSGLLAPRPAPRTGRDPQRPASRCEAGSATGIRTPV